jgi:cytochrome b561
MQLRNTKTGYGLVAQTLHWAVAGLIVYQYILAERAEAATLFQQLGILARHKSIGITILGLAFLRLLWRLSQTHPAPPPNEPHYRIVLARWSHRLLYSLIVLMPVTGWIMSSAANTPVSYFGWFTLPNFVSPLPDSVESLKTLHATVFLVLIAVVAVHAGAALYHHFVVKNDVLRRMLPFSRRRS